MLIGIDGHSGSGKSTLVKKLTLLDDEFIHLDVDVFSNKIIFNQEFKKQAIKLLGKEIIDIDNNLKKKEIANIIFNNSTLYKLYNQMAETFLYEEVDDFISANQEKFIIIDWALLSESKYFRLCDYKILIYARASVRRKRVVKRDNIDSLYFDLKNNKIKIKKKNNYDLLVNGENIKDDDLVNILIKIQQKIL